MVCLSRVRGLVAQRGWKKSPQGKGQTWCPRQASGFCHLNIIFCGFRGVCAGVDLDVLGPLALKEDPSCHFSASHPLPSPPSAPTAYPTRTTCLLSHDPRFPISGHSGHSCPLLSRLALGPATHWARPAAPCQDKTEEASQAPGPL